MDDRLGLAILEELNELARNVNATYEEVNTRSATTEQLRARVTTMRSHLARIEQHIVNDTVLKSV